MQPESRGETRAGFYGCLGLQRMLGHQWVLQSAGVGATPEGAGVGCCLEDGVDATVEGAGVGCCWEECQAEAFKLEGRARHGSMCELPRTHWNKNMQHNSCSSIRNNRPALPHQPEVYLEPKWLR